MKTVLEFSMPEDKVEFENAYKGSNYKRVIEELDQRLRSLHKYQDQHTIGVEEVRAILVELLNEYAVL